MDSWIWDDDEEEDAEWFSPTPFSGGDVVRREEEEEEGVARAVLHPFGRGQFKAVAQQVVIPPIVLEELLKGKGRDVDLSWPHDSAGSRTRARASAEAKFKAKSRPTWTPQMGGVRSPYTYTTSPAMRPSLSHSSRVSNGASIDQDRSSGVSPKTSKVRVSGRGRALKMRAEQYRSTLRKPGQGVSPCGN